MKFLFSLAGLLLLFYVVAALALYLLQRSFIYYPSPVIAHELTEQEIVADDGTALNVIIGNKGMTEAVIYFGGNAESVAVSGGEFTRALSDRTIYLVNYRGYGTSGGLPTEQNLFNDAALVFDTVSRNHRRVSVIGRSLGSGVACWLASQRPVEKLILITPYDSILKIAQAAYPIFPVRFLLKDQFRSIDYTASIDSPVLAILAEHDTVIPEHHSHKLINSFRQDVEARVLPGTDHNNLQDKPEYYSLIRDFIK